MSTSLRTQQCGTVPPPAVPAVSASRRHVEASVRRRLGGGSGDLSGDPGGEGVEVAFAWRPPFAEGVEVTGVGIGLGDSDVVLLVS